MQDIGVSPGSVFGWESFEQESLMEAAVRQAGSLQDAGQRIGHLALGLAAAAGLWTRRLPDTPELQLRIFGPAMGRMLADGGDTVLNRRHLKPAHWTPLSSPAPHNGYCATAVAEAGSQQTVASTGRLS